MSESWPVNVASAGNCQSVWHDGSRGVVNDKAGKADGSPDLKGPPSLCSKRHIDEYLGVMGGF